MLFGLSIFFYVSTIILLIYNFKWFHPNSECSRNLKILIANILSIILMTVMTVSGLGKNGSIITSGAQSFYVTYFTFSSLSSTPEPTCNALINSNKVMIVEISVGTFLFLCSLIYMALSSNQTSPEQISKGKNINLST